MVKKKLSRKKEKDIPDGVKVIAVLYYIASFLALVGGLFILIGAESFAILSFLGILFIGFFGAMGLLAIVFSVLFFFIARGLLKGED